MRPKLNLPNLFAQAGTGTGSRDTIPDELGIPDTERDTSQSGLTLKAPVTEPPPSPRHTLSDLEGFLAARLLRLEITSTSYEDAALLVLARRLRSALAAAGGQAEPATSGIQTFEVALGETLRGVYAWAFGALDASFLGEHVRPLPKRLVRDLVDHAEAAELLVKLEPSLVDLDGILREVRGASEQLAHGRG